MRYVQSGSCNLSALFLPLEDQTWNCRTSASGRYRRMPSEVVQYKVLIYLRRPIRWDVAFANLLLDP